ncbi:MAG: hypothetical protein VB140_02645 [Burkholderia sp.]
MEERRCYHWRLIAENVMYRVKTPPETVAGRVGIIRTRMANFVCPQSVRIA